MNQLMKKILNDAKIDCRHIEKHADEDFSKNMEKAIQLIIFECEKHIAAKMEIDGNLYTMQGELLKLFDIKLDDIVS